MTYTPAPVGPFYTPAGGYTPPTVSTPQIAYPNTQTPVNLVPGRVVNNESEIAPNDVRMDGSVSLFPMTDGSKIFMKTWDGNGNIKTITYTPMTEEELKAQSDTPIVTMNDLFNILTDVNNNVKTLAKKQNHNYKNKHNNQNGSSNVSYKEDKDV